MKDNIDPTKQKIIKEWLGTGSINLFGPQFAGKDTQGEKLVELFNAAPLLGGGDILRNSVIPQHVEEFLNQGILVPIKDYIEIVLPYLTNPAFIGKPLILSAVGRWDGEQEGVLEVTTKSNHPLRAVIYITLPEEITWERWKKTHPQSRNGGLRQDEAEHALKRRLNEFDIKTLPVIAFYRKMGILVEVDGSQVPQKVFADIMDSLYQRAKS